MLAGLSALRKKKKPESESGRRMLVESESATASMWEKRLLAESESETSTTWEQRMLDREAGVRMQSGKRQRKDQDVQQIDDGERELTGWASKMLQREFAGRWKLHLILKYASITLKTCPFMYFWMLNKIA